MLEGQQGFTFVLQVVGNLPPDPVFSPLHQNCMEFLGTRL